MILDSLTFLAGGLPASGGLTGQAVNGAGVFLGTNTLDLAPLTLGGNQLGDTGTGEPLNIAVTVMTAPTVGTSVKFQLIQADDAALSVNVQVLSSSDDIPIASLPVGTLIPLAVNRVGAYPPKRFVGLRFINVGAIATASYIGGFIKDVQTVKGMLFKTGYTVA